MAAVIHSSLNCYLPLIVCERSAIMNSPFAMVGVMTSSRGCFPNFHASIFVRKKAMLLLSASGFSNQCQPYFGARTGRRVLLPRLDGRIAFLGGKAFNLWFAFYRGKYRA